MKKRLWMLLLAVAALLALCLGAAACDGGNEKSSISVVFHGTSDVTVTADAGDTIDPPADPQKTGYTFAGWFIDAALTDPFDAEKTYSENFEVWAKFTANTDTPYTVKHLQQDVAGDGYTEVTADRENKTGTTDTQTAAQAKTYVGFTAQTVTQVNIAGDGSTVVEIRYDRNTFDVTLVNGTESKTIEGVRYGASAAVLYADENVPAKQGYAFGGWYTSENAKVEETAVLTAAATYTAQFTANTDTPYKVEHYLEALDGSYAIAAEETQNLTGTTDATVQAQAKSIEHYVFDEDNAGNVASGTVAADGSLVLKLYYTREVYNITFKNGDAVLGEPQPVKYGAMPAYTGETPERAATTEFVYLFKDFGTIVAAEADAEYSAQYYEVKNYSGYIFTEAFTLPDISAAFAGAEVKQYIDDTEIVAADEQQKTAGGYEWRIAVMDGGTELSSAVMNIEVCTEADYWANYGSGDTDQFESRFFVDGNSLVTFGYTSLDEDVYGVSGAYHYTAAGQFAAYNQRIIFTALEEEGAPDASVYQAFTFDAYVVGGTPSFDYLVIGEGAATTSYESIKITDASGVRVAKNAVAAGQWYHCTVQLPYTNEGAVNFKKMILILTSDNQAAELYLRDLRFEKEAALSDGGDFFREMTNLKATLSLVGEDEGIDLGGRKNVYKYVSTGDTWSSRVQFGRAARDQWNALAADENAVLSMEVYFTGSLTSLYVRPIDVSGLEAFYTSDQTYAKVYDPNGVLTTSTSAGVWYTIEIDISAVGEVNYNIKDNDVGLQIAANASNATFYIGSVGFQEARPAPEPLQWVPDYFVSMSGSGGSIAYAAEGGGRTDVYKYTSAKSAWESRVQFTLDAFARYNELCAAGGGKLVFDVYFEAPLTNIQFWYVNQEGMKDFTSNTATIATLKDGEGAAVSEAVSGVWYTLEIDIAALGELVNDTTNGNVGLQMAANSDGGVFYIDNIHFEAAA